MRVQADPSMVAYGYESRERYNKSAVQNPKSKIDKLVKSQNFDFYSL